MGRRRRCGALPASKPAEESELLAELRRIADALDLGDGIAGLKAALRAGAGELVCFIPPSRRAERVAYTLEGDPVTFAEATWRLREPRVALAAMRGAPELSFDGTTEDREGMTFEWLASRRALLANRPELPAGAIVMEGGPVGVRADGELELDDITSLGTFTLREDRLDFVGISEARLIGAVALVERHLGSVAGRPTQNVRFIEEVSAARNEPGAPSVPAKAGRRHTAPDRYEAPTLPDARLRDLTYRRWVDDPDSRLGGMSPREAAEHDVYRDELERALRSFEHHNARQRDDALLFHGHFGVDTPVSKTGMGRSVHRGFESPLSVSRTSRV